MNDVQRILLKTSRKTLVTHCEPRCTISSVQEIKNNPKRINFLGWIINVINIHHMAIADEYSQAINTNHPQSALDSMIHTWRRFTTSELVKQTIQSWTITVWPIYQRSRAKDSITPAWMRTDEASLKIQTKWFICIFSGYMGDRRINSKTIASKFYLSLHLSNWTILSWNWGMSWPIWKKINSLEDKLDTWIYCLVVWEKVVS